MERFRCVVLFLWTLLLAAVAGCVPSDRCDLDRDGFAAMRCGGLDCNDATYLAAPGELEICDGLDNDCDGEIDGDSAANPPTWYEDLDGDGYGSLAVTTAACDAPAGYVNNGLDCDDTMMLIRPGAIETCDGVDNDCDEEIDEAGSQFSRNWFPDADGDGYGGTGGTPVVACNNPGGHADNDGDCDDANPDVHPDAEDLCDQQDSNCDGVVEFLWYPDADGDGYGDDAGVQDECDPGDGWVQLGGDCDDTEAAAHPGEAEVCGDGIDNDCDGGGAAECGMAGTLTVQDALWTMTGTGIGDSFALGDVTGDGVADLVVPSSSQTQSAPGVLSVLSGVPDGAGSVEDERTAAIEGEVSMFGVTVSASGDANGDGTPDLLVGESVLTALSFGRAYLFLGPVSGVLDRWDADATGVSPLVTTDFARAVGFVPDIDDDGDDEIFIASAYYPVSEPGAVYLFYGGPAADQPK